MDFLVCVCCKTYNQKIYITDALNGFVMQKTNFPFVAVIIDDASTDGEQEVIHEYVKERFDHSPDSVFREWETEDAFWTLAQHKENKNCHFVVVYLKKNLFGSPKKNELIKEYLQSKYIALCEGDDYWTNPMKLQKQADFLEEHEDYSMCFHKVFVVSDVENDSDWFSQIQEGDYSNREIYQQWTIPTCTAMYRTDSKNPFENNPAVVFGDIFLWLQLAERGKLRCIGFVGATYRRHQGSASCCYPVETSVKLYYQYKFFEKRFPDLVDISRRKQDYEGLADIIKAPYFPGIWKYRFLYMFRHRRLFLSSFFVKTIFLYTPLRNLWFWRNN